MSEDPVPYIAHPGDASDRPDALRRRAIMAALRAREAPALPPPVVSLPGPDAPLASERHALNVVANGHRTSLRLEAAVWEALILVAALENVPVNTLVSQLDRLRTPDACRLTEAARIYPLLYLRRMAGV